MTNSEYPLLLGVAPWQRRDYLKRQGNLAFHYDLGDASSLTIDSSLRVSLIADKSGNSAVNCLCLNGVAGNYASAPDSAALSITGDIDIRWHGYLASWTAPAATSVFGSKWAGAGNSSYIFRITNTGLLQLTFSSDGTALLSGTATTALTTPAFTKQWVRVTRAASSGSTNFYTSTDGSTWVQVGTTVASTAGNIFDSATVLEIGSRNAGSTEPLAGVVYRFQIYNGIAGTIAFDANFALAAKLATSFTESSANAATVTINTSGDTGARISGERDLYQGTLTKQPIYLFYAGDKYAYFPGGSVVNSVSTPHAANQEATTQVDIQAKVFSTDYANMSGYIYSKNGASNFSGYAFRVSTGTLRMDFGDGGSKGQSASINLSTVAASGILYIRGTLNTSSGGNYVSTFYYKLNFGDAWTQLGSAVSTAGATSISAAGGLTYLGRQNAGPGGYLNARVYSATFSTTIGGAAVVSVDFNTYNSGATFTGTTGETWTVNDGATIVTRTCLYGDGSDDYMKAPAFSLPQPETVCFVGQQVSWTGNDTIFDGESNNAMLLSQHTSSPNVYLYATGVDAGTDVGTWTIQTGAALSSVFNAPTGSLRVNRGTSVAQSMSAGVPAGFTLFSKGTPNNYGNATASEIAGFSVVRNAAQQLSDFLYFQRKWSIRE